MRLHQAIKSIRRQMADGEFALFGAAYNLSRAEDMFTFEELMARVERKAA